MTEAWLYECTEAGWEVRNENGLVVATVPDAHHEREVDAERIATAPFETSRLRDAFGLLLGNLEDEIIALRTKITSLVRTVADDANALTESARVSGPDGADPTWIVMRGRELSEERTELHMKLARLRQLKSVVACAEKLPDRTPGT